MVQWGTVPDWFSAVGSVAALFFAGGAAWAAIRGMRQQDLQIRRMEASERRREEEREREQASQVAAWIILETGALPSVICVNASGRPVYNVLLTMRAGSLTLACDYAVKGPDAAPKKLNYATGQLLEMGHPSDTDWTTLYRSGDLRVSMRYQDVVGKIWERSEEGRLRLLSSPSLATAVTRDAGSQGLKLEPSD